MKEFLRATLRTAKARGEERRAEARARLHETCGESPNKARRESEKKKRREQVELVRLHSEGTANYHIIREQNSKHTGQPKAGEQKAEVREEEEEEEEEEQAGVFFLFCFGFFF